MDYKKRNEEILEKLRALRDDWASTDNRAAKEIEEAIPELIESEDERIMKEIIDFATKANNGITSILANNYNFDKWIAWIEKRAEQKTVVIIPKFRVGDTIRLKNSCAQYQITEISDGCYRGKGWGLDINAADESEDYELVKQKPAMIQWNGNNLREVVELTGLYKEGFAKWFHGDWDEYECYVHSHNNIFKLFNEDGSHYEVPVGAWIVRTPDGYNIASKAVFKPASIEWSEEDEEIVEALNDYVKNLDILFSEIKISGKDILSKEFREKVQLWLKSLRPQNHWNELRFLKILKELQDIANQEDGCLALENLQLRLSELTREVR